MAAAAHDTAAAQGTARAPQGSGPVGVGFIGTGMISDTYLEHLTSFPDVRVVILGDLDVDRAKAQAEKWGVGEWGTADDVLAHPDVELVEVVYGDDDDQTSFDRTAALLQTYPELKGIVSPTTVGIAAAARYLSDSEYKGKVALTGLGLPNEMRPFVKDGTVTAFALWDPAQLGYVAAFAGKALADGTITGAEGDTFDAGELGEREVGADGIVIVGPPTVFDAENIDQYDF